MITATVIDQEHAQLSTPEGCRDIVHTDVRVGLIEALRHEAHTRGRIDVLIEDHLDRKWLRAIVTPDGQAHVDEHTRPYKSRTPVKLEPISQSSLDTPTAKHTAETTTPAVESTPVETALPAVPRRRAEVGTLLTSTPMHEPAQTGLRGALSRLGIRMKPSQHELEYRADVRAVSQHWPGLRTVAIANPKGGANKTPTTLMLAAVFARRGGSGVVAWDNNETRGTLGWRSEQGPHASTVLDLLPHVEELLDPSARAGDLARYLHHQPTDRYDVLRSDDAVESDHEVDADEVDDLHRVLGKYYRLMFIDTGNSERANNWRAALAHADQLVVPMVGREDTAEAAALMLDALHARDEDSQRLAQNAIAIVSQQTPTDQINWIVERFRPLVKQVVTIPHDPALKAGVIRFDALNRKTQRAWLHAAAAVAGNL